MSLLHELHLLYSAMSLSGGSVIPINNVKFSSVSKGESLEDTIQTISCMCDAIVLRHDQKGAAKQAAEVSSVPVINAAMATASIQLKQFLMDLRFIIVLIILLVVSESQW